MCMAFSRERRRIYQVLDNLNPRLLARYDVDGNRWSVIPVSGQPPALAPNAAAATGLCYVPGRKKLWFFDRTPTVFEIDPDTGVSTRLTTTGTKPGPQRTGVFNRPQYCYELRGVAFASGLRTGPSQYQYDCNMYFIPE
jgi:hypothetical protein